MRAVIQRVTSAKVEVEGKVTGEIGKGFLILFGVGQEDTAADCDKLADKISKLRIFADENDKTNLSITMLAEIFFAFHSSPFMQIVTTATARHLSMQASLMKPTDFMNTSARSAVRKFQAR